MRKNIGFFLFFVFLLISDASFSQKKWTIQQCMDYANENNIDIQSSILSIKRAEIGALQSKLDYAPNVSGNSNYSYNSGRVLDPTTYTFVENRTVNNISMGLSAGTTIFAGLQKYNNLKKSIIDLDASRTELVQLQNNISLNVSLYYLQILLNKEVVESVKRQIESSDQNIERTRNLVAAGSATQGDLLNLVAQRSDEELSLADAQLKLNNSKIDLCQIMNLPSYAGFDIDTPMFTVNLENANFSVDSVYSVAVNLPEIKSKLQRMESSKYALRYAKSAYYPRISANYGYNTSFSDSRRKVLLDSNGQPTMENGQVVYTNYPFGDQLRDNQSHGLGFSLSVPIFNAFSVRNNVKLAKLNVQQAEYDIDKARNTLYKNVNQAISDVVGAKMQYLAAVDKLKANEETLRYTEERFKNGLSTLTDYVLAKNNILMTEARLAQAKYTFIFKLEVIDYYLCRGISF